MDPALLFIKLLFGHVFGDYFLQSNVMAENKNKKGLKGAVWCTIHCLIYTASVCLFLWTINIWVALIVFITHWPIDRWSLAQKWMDLVKSRNIMRKFQSKNPYRDIQLVFSCIVYIAVDNFSHLILMFYSLQLFIY